MLPEFSVIIPARNAAKTIAACLQAIDASSVLPSEVLVVNDGSSDATKDCASAYPCRIVDVCLQRGPMEARYEGARKAKSDILVFIDADVCVSPGSFEKILDHFKDAGLSAVTGLLAPTAPDENFFSAYKNEYMNFIFKRQPRESLFLYGSLWAIRAGDMIYFDAISKPFGSLVSDSEMGFRLRMSGKRILLDKTLAVTHLKKYQWYSLLQNDFKIPFLFSVMLLRYRAMFSKTRRRRFSHASTGQALATVLSGTAVATLILGCALVSGPLMVLALWQFFAVFLYWIPFLKQVYGARDAGWALKAAAWIPLDGAVMCAGMMSGFVYGLAGLFAENGTGCTQ
ncbi:MAG: glycosyltransferase family 2 protein [Candidatus Omnitrophica bacterium]|nr:glycosyltransferase family 2 protein [Candidatus Omnitrophota bacterium]